jgi:hypothetical protein
VQTPQQVSLQLLGGFPHRKPFSFNHFWTSGPERLDEYPVIAVSIVVLAHPRKAHHDVMSAAHGAGTVAGKCTAPVATPRMSDVNTPNQKVIFGSICILIPSIFYQVGDGGNRQ